MTGCYITRRVSSISALIATSVFFNLSISSSHVPSLSILLVLLCSPFLPLTSFIHAAPLFTHIVCNGSFHYRSIYWWCMPPYLYLCMPLAPICLYSIAVYIVCITLTHSFSAYLSLSVRAYCIMTIRQPVGAILILDTAKRRMVNEVGYEQSEEGMMQIKEV